LTIALFSLSLAGAKKSPFKGTWCIGRDRMVIDFIGKDSIHIYSKADESVNGRGTFIKNDTTFVASLKNNDLELKMGYQYRLVDSESLKAKITFFTVDGDSVDHPKRWLRMSKCDPESFDFESIDAKEENED
jgi:hypothetical protein